MTLQRIRKVFELILLAAGLPTINLLLFKLIQIHPSHDTLVFTQKLYAITQSLHFEASLTTYLPNIRFGIASSAWDTVSVESLPALLFGALFNTSPSILFNVYYLSSSIILGLLWWKIFTLLDVSRESAKFGIVIVGTVNFPLWQIWFNYQLFFQVTYLLLAIVVLIRHHPRRWFIFVSINILFIPLGHPIYFSIFLYYLELFILLLTYKKILPFKDCIYEMRKVSTMLALVVFIPTLIFIVLKNALILKAESAIISPGARNYDGTVTFNDFLNYGGASGPSKLISILGETNPSSLDFTLFTSLTGLPILVLVVMSKMNKHRISYPLPILSIVTGILVVTLPFSLLSTALYQFPGMDYVRHLSFFSATVKPFLLLLTVVTIDSQNLANVKRILLLSSSACVVLFLARQESFAIGLTAIFVIGHLLVRKLSSQKNWTRVKKEIQAKRVLYFLILFSNLVIFFSSSPVQESKLPLINIVNREQEIELDKEATGSLTKTYLNMSTKSKMTTYDALALQLKRSYCIDLRTIKDANNAPVRSDIEASSLQGERSRFEEICRLGGVRFWEWNGQNLIPAVVRYNLSVYLERTSLDYEIENFNANKEYFVQLSQTRWSVRDFYSPKLESIGNAEICRSCVSFEIDSDKGFIEIRTDYYWRVLQNCFLLMVILFSLLTMRALLGAWSSDNASNPKRGR